MCHTVGKIKPAPSELIEADTEYGVKRGRASVCGNYIFHVDDEYQSLTHCTAIKTWRPIKNSS